MQAGHSTTAIEGFLRDQVGYCEQFAGTYAAMMRTLGIPARVAVGFTPGNPNDEGDFSVLGKNAHAWPEVWFDGFGWVPFEPTPGRGAPGAENYTDVPAQQDSSGVDPDLQATGTGDAPPPNDPAGRDIEPFEPTAGAPNTTLPGTFADGNRSESTAAATVDDSSGSAVPWRTLGVIAAVGLVLALPALFRRVRRRRVLSGDVATLAAAYWRRALDAVAEIGIRHNAASTPLEQAEYSSLHFPVASRPLRSLADAVTTAAYAPHDDATTMSGDCALWCHQIERAVNDSITPIARVRRYFTKFD